MNPVEIASERARALDKNMMMFYTGIVRNASSIAGSYVSNLDSKSVQLTRMQDMVDKAVEILTDGELDDFGRLLDESWTEKRSLSKNISNERIDKFYSLAKNAGALGGKLAGAGAGGMMMFYVPVERQENVKEQLKGLLHIPFNFETSGSTIIFSE